MSWHVDSTALDGREVQGCPTFLQRSPGTRRLAAKGSFRANGCLGRSAVVALGALATISSGLTMVAYRTLAASRRPLHHSSIFRVA